MFRRRQHRLLNSQQLIYLSVDILAI